MDLLAEITSIEATLKGRQIPLHAVLTAAGIDRSTWTRWKAGATLPRMRTWILLKDAVAEACCQHDLVRAKAFDRSERPSV